MRRKLPPGTLDRLWRDPANWRGLGIYRCAEDPRIIVPKRIPIFGWTVNWAHRRSLLTVLGVAFLVCVILGAAAKMLSVPLWGAAIVTGIFYGCHRGADPRPYEERGDS